MHSISNHIGGFNVKLKLSFFVVLTCAGLVGNFYNYPIFFDLHFIFGSMFAMLALQMLGLGHGIACGAIISLMTYHLWNHPYAIIIMTCEVIAVGLLMQRKNIGLVLADAIYWLFIGMPLVLLFYHAVMNLTLSSVTITMLKQALNGITNALIARLIFMLLSFLTQRSHFSLREIVFNLLAIFMLVPSMLLTMIQSKYEFEETDKEIQNSLERMLGRESDTLNSRLESDFKPILYLTRRALDTSVPDMQTTLEQIHSVNSDFLRIGLVDRDGIVAAYSPRVDEQGTLNTGKDFSDRPHMHALKETLKPMLGEVVMGRIGRPRPIVTMLSPVIDQGRFNGYVVGVFDLEKVNDVLFSNLSHESLPGLRFTLLDKNSRVIATNHADKQPMDIFSRPEGELTPIRANIYQWSPLSPRNISVSDKWKNSLYVAEQNIGSIFEWKLVFEQPIAPFQKKLFEKYSIQMVIIFLLLITALILAEMTSRGVIGSLNKLREITSGLPEKISAQNPVIWPTSMIEETQSLLANFKEMTRTLVHNFDEIKKVEEVVRGSLMEKEILLKEIHHRVKNNMQIISSLLDIQALKIEDEPLRNMLQESQRRVKSMALVHERLYQTSNFSRIDFGEYISTILRELMTLYQLNHKAITTKIDANHIELDIDRAVPCALIINELITNCCKYAFPGDAIGGIEISFVTEEDMYVLTIKDDGIGMQPDVNHNNSGSLGLQLVFFLTKQLRGSFRTYADRGTTSVVKFPRSINKNGKNKSIDR